MEVVWRSGSPNYFADPADEMGCLWTNFAMGFTDAEAKEGLQWLFKIAIARNVTRGTTTTKGA